MPAPSQYAYSVAAAVAAQTSLRDLIDSHATLPGVIRVLDAADVLLGTVPLADPCGTVNGGTGQLAFDIDPVPRDEGADVGGTVAYVEVCDGAGAVHLILPAKAGSTQDSGWAVFLTLTIVAGGPIELVSLVIG